MGKVYVVDDDLGIVKALTTLARTSGYLAEGFGNAQDFLEKYCDDMPSCLILDVRLPGMNGLQFLEQKELLGLTIPIILLTAHGDVPMAVRAMKQGAADFFQKPANEQQLLDAVAAAIQRHSLERSVRQNDDDFARRLAELSRRELEVLRLAAQGQQSRAIGQELGISPRTAEHHRYTALKKMGVHSVMEIVARIPNF